MDSSSLIPPGPVPSLEFLHDALGRDLEEALLPLLAYCEKQEAQSTRPDWSVQHVERIRAALDAIVAYGTNADHLVAALHQRTGLLEPWPGIAYRLFDRFRSYQAPKSPLVLRIEHLLTSPSLQARHHWSDKQRSDASLLSSHSLSPSANG